METVFSLSDFLFFFDLPDFFSSFSFSAFPIFSYNIYNLFISNNIYNLFIIKKNI